MCSGPAPYTVGRRGIGGVLALLLPLLAVASGQASGQCILANPSFEIDGSGGPVFGGWAQFGQTGVVDVSSHGAQAARVTGPGGAGWEVSGYWQRLDCEPGEQWEVTGHVQHPSGNPLTGDCAAIVNFEWRDAAGELIDSDWLPVADANSPTDEYLDFTLLGNPAPAGTAAIHVLFGVLDAPDDPSPDVYYDQVTIFSTSPPTMDEMQWMDFPGGMTLTFGNHLWRVKGPGYYGPGPNVFSDDPECVWVDGQGQLHLTLSDQGSYWASTEVVLESALGYGDYIVTTVGRLDLLDLHAVLGIFLWQYGPCWDEAYLWWNPFNEIDIEYSRWGYAGNEIGQFVAQPYDWPGNRERFDATFAEGEVASHAMRWRADRVEYRVWRGGPYDESPETMIHAWTYEGPHIPRPEQPRMHLNLWKLEGTPSSDQEVVFSDFVFVPEQDVSAVPGRARPGERERWGAFDHHEPFASGRLTARLLPLRPSPLLSQSEIRFELFREARMEVDILSVDGRRIGTLSSDVFAPGIHTIPWDGRDERGRRLEAGSYWIRLSGASFEQVRRATILR